MSSFRQGFADALEKFQGGGGQLLAGVDLLHLYHHLGRAGAAWWLEGPVAIRRLEPAALHFGVESTPGDPTFGALPSVEQDDDR